MKYNFLVLTFFTLCLHRQSSHRLGPGVHERQARNPKKFSSYLKHHALEDIFPGVE